MQKENDPRKQTNKQKPCGNSEKNKAIRKDKY